MKHAVKNLLILLTLAAIQCLCLAHAYSLSVSELVQILDVNKDGEISLKEAVRHTELLQNFGLIDENEDGKLTQVELEKSKLIPTVTSKIAEVKR